MPRQRCVRCKTRWASHGEFMCVECSIKYYAPAFYRPSPEGMHKEEPEQNYTEEGDPFDL